MQKLRERARRANDRADPAADALLARIAASRYSALWVAGFGLACFALGAALF